MKYLRIYEAKKDDVIRPRITFLLTITYKDKNGIKFSNKIERVGANNYIDIFERFDQIKNYKTNQQDMVVIDSFSLKKEEIIIKSETISNDKIEQMPEYKEYILQKAAKKYNL